MKKGFTLIELIMVIVVLAIISLFTTNIYTNIYMNYIVSKSINNLETQSELLLDQIASLLSQRITSSTIARNTAADFVYIDDSSSSYHILEWVGMSQDGRYLGDATAKAGWSGLLENSGTSVGGNIISPGSNFNTQNALIANDGIVFKETRAPDRHGWGYAGKGDSTAKVMTVAANTNNTMNGVTTNNSSIYYVARTAYAIVPSEPDARGMFTLTLHHTYQPWREETYLDGTSSTLADNVTEFRFRGFHGSIEIKVCLRDPDIQELQDANFDFRVCKAKVVL